MLIFLKKLSFQRYLKKCRNLLKKLHSWAGEENTGLKTQKAVVLYELSQWETDREQRERNY